ncbi:unnamed protein product, partial [Closterium sp. NIES-53]
GRPIQFDTWLDDLQLYLLSDSRDSVSLFDHTFGAAPAPPATADSATRSQTAQALYDAVVAHYSSPATAALGRRLMPYLFPELSAFATVEDLVSHLRTSDARYRAALPAEFLDRNPPPIVVALGAARGTPRTPYFEGCSPSPLAPSYASAAAVDVLGAEDVRVASTSAKRRNSKGKGGRGGGGGSGGGGGGSGGSGGGSGGFGGGGGGSGGSGCSGSSGSGGGRTGAQHGGSGGGQRQQHQCRSETPLPQQLREWFAQCGASGGNVIRTEFGDEAERPRLVDLLRSGVAIFDLDYDDILAAIYALSVSAEGDCYLCVPPDPGVEAAALGASESVLYGTTHAEALHTFTLDSGASHCFFRDSTTLTPLSAPVPVRLADPSRGPVLARSSTVLPCPAVLSGSVSGLHLSSFSTNLVSTAALQDAMVTPTTPAGQRVSIYTCTRTGRHLATFTRRPGSSLYTLATEPPQVAASAQVFASGQVFASPPALACPALPTLRRGAVARRSSLLFVSPDDCSPADPPHGRGQVVDVLIPWIHAVRLQLCERFRADLPVLRLHSDRGGEFSSVLLRDICHGEGILESFTISDSPQKNGIVERRIGLVMEVTRTSMIHAAAPHFLWPFAVWYAAHQLNLWPRVSLPEISPTLRWTGKVGDASVFRVWGSRAFVRDTSADTFSARAIPCDVTFDELVPFYRLFSYRFAPPPPPPLFLAPGPPPVDPLSPQGPAPLGVSKVDPLPCAPVEVAIGSSVARGAASGGAEPGGAEPEGAETAGVEPGGAEPGGVEPGGAETRGIASFGGHAGASPRLSPRPEPLSPQQLHEWFAQLTRLRNGAAGAGDSDAGDTGARGAGVTAGTGGTGGATAAGPGGACTRGTGAAGTCGVGGAGAGDPTEPGAAGARGAGVVDAGAGGTGAGGTGAGGAGSVDPGAGGAGGTVRPRAYFIPLLKQTGSLTERRKPASCPASPVRTGCRVPHPRPPPVPDTHAMALHPSSVPLCVPLPPPPESSLPFVPDPESDRARAASQFVSRLLATIVTDPSFESTTASALVAELFEFAGASCLDYAAALVAESESASPPSVGGECALGTNVLEDKQEDFECLAAAVPHFASMQLAPEGDPDAPDIPTPRSYAEAITGGRLLPYLLPHPEDDYSSGVAQRDYELHSLDFNTTFLQGSLHEEIWLRRPPGLTWSFLAGLQLRLWGLLLLLMTRRCFYAATHRSRIFYVLVYVDDLVFATADNEALTLVKSELQKRHNCTDLVTHGAPSPSALRLPVLLAIAHSSVYRPLALSSTFGRVLRQAWGSCLEDGVQLSSLVTQTLLGSSCEAEIYAGAMAAEELRWLTYLLTDLGEKPRSPPVLYQRGQLRLAYVATRANTADIFTKALPPGDHQRFSTVLGLLALVFLTGLVTTSKGVYYVKAGTDGIWVPGYTLLPELLLQEAHDEVTSGHLGVEKIRQQLQRYYYWPEMLTDVQRHVASCPTCQLMKSSRKRPAGQLQPIPPPERAWQQVTMDFVTGLQAGARGKDAILVIVDQLTKMAHFAACNKSILAEETARLFISTIVRLHGIPAAIISDRDTKFTSNFWQNLWQQFGTRLQFSSSYHPETDGQTERTNQTMEQFIRATCDDPTTWEQQLPLIEFAYSNSPSAMTQQSPFDLNYG